MDDRQAYLTKTRHKLKSNWKKQQTCESKLMECPIATELNSNGRSPLTEIGFGVF